MNRVFGILIVGLWLVGVALLVNHDVLPYLRAGEPPQGQPPEGSTQMAILDAHEKPVGKSWLSVQRLGERTIWTSTTQLSLSLVPFLALPSGPMVTFDTVLTYQKSGTLESFETKVFGLPARVEVVGHLLGVDYSCVARLGDQVHTMSIDARVSRGLAEAMRPFTHLTNLQIGQSWQVQVLEPMSLLRPGGSPEFRATLVEVTGIDHIPYQGRTIECFRVQSEGGQATAWVDRQGRVIAQTVSIPGIGKIHLRDEPYDENARRGARSEIRDRRAGR